ncbi:cyclic pyranopterin monophosphate synthase 3 [Striga asiatica]|uniref:Cyclic pyranopterin monophosphate synthase 3 n=1 Tax=Striga asiatica TaxID=4170 RepID=A0A5A7PXT7_STRAF|nr:cyclic pyranopterin monophosphate synthase 3 [Striga asiatica]
MHLPAAAAADWRREMTWRAEEETRPEVGSSTSKTPGPHGRGKVSDDLAGPVVGKTEEAGVGEGLLDREVGEEGVVLADVARQAAEGGRVDGATIIKFGNDNQQLGSDEATQNQ